jgi:hypothetical protein
MNQSKVKSVARDRLLIAAIGEHFTRSTVITLDGQSYKAKELLTMLQDHVDAVSAADVVKTKWQTAVGVATAKGSSVAGILPALRRHVLGTYGADSQAMKDFGFTAKVGKATAEVVAAAVQKRAATRKARGTMGKRQKAKIKGDVTPAIAAPAATASAAPVVVGNVPAPAATP